MSSESATPYPELLALFIALSDGSISGEDFAHLDALLASDPQARAFYLEFTRTSAMLEQRAKAQVETDTDEVDLEFWSVSQGSDGWSLKDVEHLFAPPSGSASLVDLTDELARRKREEKKLAHQRARANADRRGHRAPELHSPFVIPKAVVWLGFAAAMLLAVVLISINTRKPVTDARVAVHPEPDAGEDVQPTLSTVATLTYADRAVWSGGRGQMAIDHRVGPGAIRLESGVAHFLLDSGAVVMLRGPVEIDLTSRWEARLAEGQVVARVPERAHGFKVVGEGFEITDLGTEFAVRVSDADVHCRVVLGEVELVLAEGGTPSPDIQRLRENHGVVMELATGSIREISADEDDDIAWALPYAALLSRELVANGGFEDGAFGIARSENEVDDVAIPGWKSDGAATVLEYEQAGVQMDVGFPHPQNDPMPEGKGSHYYFGRHTGTTTQTIDLSVLAPLTDAGQANYVLGGDLGGYINQNDRVLVSATFYDAAGRELGRSELEPVDAAARRNLTGFIRRTQAGALPPGTRSARIEVKAVHAVGSFTDGFADNISLVVEVDSSDAELSENTPGSRALQTNGGHAAADDSQSNSLTKSAMLRAGLSR